MADVAPPPYSTSAGYASTATSQPPSSTTAASGSQLRILEQIELNRRLKATISDNQGTSQEYENQVKSVQDLKDERGTLKLKLTQLTSRRQLEELDFNSYRNSTIKKAFMSKGKFAARSEKEEKENKAALEKEQDAKVHYVAIQEGIRYGEKLMAELESQNACYLEALQQLDELYSDIFDGPTREAPEEDRLEAVAKERRTVFEQANRDKVRETSAASALKDALHNLEQAKVLSASNGVGISGSEMGHQFN